MHPLDTKVGGGVTVGAPGDVNIANKGDLNITNLDADGNAAADRDVTLTAGGDLNSDKQIKADNAEINTVDGNVGSSDNPLDLSVDHLDGTISGDGQNPGTGNATITNDKDLEIGDLTAAGELNLNVKGTITGEQKADGEDPANVTAKKADITATGDVGTTDKPLTTAVDELSINSGGDVNVNSTKSTTIERSK